MTAAEPWVFLSHTAQDRETADRLCSYLEAAGIPCWVAHRDTPEGCDWSQVLLDAIRRTPTMVVLISRAANSSQHVDREVAIAFESDTQFFPVCIEDIEPASRLYYHLGGVQFLRAADTAERDWMQLLVDRIRELAPPPGNEPRADRDEQTSPSIAATDASTESSAPRFTPFAAIAALLFTTAVVLFALDWIEQRNRQPVDPGGQPPIPAPMVSWQEAILATVEEQLATGERLTAITTLETSLKRNGPDPQLSSQLRELVVRNSIGMRLLRVPAGDFYMGSPPSEEAFDDERQHFVSIPNDFFLGETEVTRGQFRAFVKATGYTTTAEHSGGAHYFQGGWRLEPRWSWRDVGFEQDDSHPVVSVSWNDAVAFCTWLSQKEGHTYRLPDEREWERACRAGRSTRFPWGHQLTGITRHANLQYLVLDQGKTPSDDGFEHTSPIGSFKPNAWGFYDMIGNAGEWCFNPYGPYPLPEQSEEIFDVPAYLTYRGGGWSNGSPRARSAHRFKVAPDRRFSALGFRVLREL